MRLHDHHAGFRGQDARVSLIYVVIDSQMEIVFFVEISDDPNEVTCLDPKLDGPATPEGHLEEDGTLDPTGEDWLPVLVHRRT